MQKRGGNRDGGSGIHRQGGGAGRRARETARLLTEGTLLTLAARISGGEAEDLAERVPDQLRSYLIKLSEKEFTDAMAQLPKEFDQLMATASTAR